MRERGRVLLGAFPTSFAAAEYATKVTTLGAGEMTDRWLAAREAFFLTLPARRPTQLPRRRVSDAAMRTIERRLSNSELFQASLQGVDWRLERVHLADVTVTQPLVHLDRLALMVERIEREDTADLLFPLATSLEVGMLGGNGAPAMTLISDRAELVVTNIGTRRADVTGPIEVVFSVQPRPNFVTLVRKAKITAIRNGNHRLVAAWSTGFADLPCVVVEGDPSAMAAQRWDRIPIGFGNCRRATLGDLAHSWPATVEVDLKARRHAIRFAAEQRILFDGGS